MSAGTAYQDKPYEDSIGKAGCEHTRCLGWKRPRSSEPDYTAPTPKHWLLSGAVGDCSRHNLRSPRRFSFKASSPAQSVRWVTHLWSAL